MPHLRIETNVPKEKIPPNFAKEACSLLAKLLGKPENYCCVTVVPGVNMVFGGTDEPCGQCTLMSIGRLGDKENISHSKALFEKIFEIGIPNDRMYITFQDEKSSNVGYSGTTFLEIMGK